MLVDGILLRPVVNLLNLAELAIIEKMKSISSIYVDDRLFELPPRLVKSCNDDFIDVYLSTSFRLNLKVFPTGFIKFLDGSNAIINRIASFIQSCFKSFVSHT